MPYTVSSQKRTHADNTNLMVQINGVVNEYIEIEQQVDGLTSSCQVDIGKIDFDRERQNRARLLWMSAV